MRKKYASRLFTWLGTILFILNYNVLPVLASSSVRADSNATRDILRSNDMWRTSLDTIDWLTSFIDTGFATFISIVGLFIIGSALLRNVIAGAVAANPKFWDKVDQAHKALKLNTNLMSGIGNVLHGGAQMQSADYAGDDGSESTVGMFLYRILPNFKAMSDLDDPTIRPRTYFIKAIPQMFAVVYLGIFIWNGYYREVAAKVGDMGAVLTERALLDTDPIAVIDKLFNLAGTPSFGEDMNIGGFSSVQTGLAKDIYTTTIGKYSDINSKETKDSLADSIMDSVYKVLDTDRNRTAFKNDKAMNAVSLTGLDLFNDDKFSRTYNIQMIAGTQGVTGYVPPDIPFKEEQMRLADGVDEYISYHTIRDIRTEFGFDSKIDPTAVYDLKITIKYTRKVNRFATSSTNSNIGFYTSPVSSGVINKDSPLTFKIPGANKLNEENTEWKLEVAPGGDVTLTYKGSTPQQGSDGSTLSLPWNITVVSGQNTALVNKIYFSSTDSGLKDSNKKSWPPPADDTTETGGGTESGDGK